MSKYRHEYKYLIDSRQTAVLKMRAEGILGRDSHAGPEGGYRIKSLYFDDRANICYRENEAGTDPRSKIRIRYYGRDFRNPKLEKKSKERGMTKKESCILTLEECRLLMKGEIPEISADFSPEKQMLFTELKIRGLAPRVIVEYQRIPFVAPAGNVRITLDSDIVSSNQVNGFLAESQIRRPILPMGNNILEVKFDEFLPSYIKETLSLDSLQWTSFSKYYLCRKYSTNGGII